MFSRLGCTILLLALLLQIGCSYKSPVPVDLPESEMDDYTMGLRDGEFFALGDDAWILGGCILPFFAVAHALIHEPTLPEYVQQSLLNKSQEYIRGFTEAYQSKSRIENANKALTGSTLTLTLVLVSGLWLVAMSLSGPI